MADERQAGVLPPDFLWKLVASVNFMRLSSRKGAHEVLSSASCQGIRVREMAKKCELSELISLLRGFFGFGGLWRSSFTVPLGRSRLPSRGAGGMGTGWSVPGVVFACGRGGFAGHRPLDRHRLSKISVALKHFHKYCGAA
jgi:hypothetical protein